MLRKRKETMKSSVLHKEIISLINEQIWLENNASFYYLDLAIKFDKGGFGGISTFFSKQSEEEREHMLLLFHYLLEKDSTPQLPQYNFMEETEDEFDVLGYFIDSLDNERKVTNSINKIVSKCKEVGDHTTENFMQWFVTEQREEELKFKNIIDDLTIIGDDGVGLYKINKELGLLPPE